MFNQNLQRLFTIAQKETKTAIGLMSGTSLDGLDVALCRFTGHGLNTRFNLLEFVTIPYGESFRQDVQSIFAQKDGGLEKACLLNAQIGALHADLVLKALGQWKVTPAEVDFIASHGQTIYHAPRRLHHLSGYPDATLQIGDGDHLAVKSGILTISDFRQKHIAAGGEGAPLALYGDVLLAGNAGEDRILLNIGGIANLTYLPADMGSGAILCTDTGPGNTLIDAACRQYFAQPYDHNSEIAFSGEVCIPLLNALLGHPFFAEKPPKTTGPELFNMEMVRRAQQSSGMGTISHRDLVSTLSAFTAHTIAGFITQHFDTTKPRIFVSGGGARNPFVIKSLGELLPGAAIADTAALGINPDAKEAILFALLGNEALCGDPIRIGNNPAVLMGKFSFPY